MPCVIIRAGEISATRATTARGTAACTARLCLSQPPRVWLTTLTRARPRAIVSGVGSKRTRRRGLKMMEALTKLVIGMGRLGEHLLKQKVSGIVAAALAFACGAGLAYVLKREPRPKQIGRAHV